MSEEDNKYGGGCQRPCDGLINANADQCPGGVSQGGTCIRTEITEQACKPIPYTFRIAAPAKNCDAKHAKCPPFYLQLDHTLAVLWYLFEKDGGCTRKKLGVSQLQWALYFLKGVKSPCDGCRSSDVEVALQAVEDALLECYSDMANVCIRSTQKNPCGTCSKTISECPSDHSKKTADPDNNYKNMLSTMPSGSPCGPFDIKARRKTDDNNLIKEIETLRSVAATFNDKPSSQNKSGGRMAAGHSSVGGSSQQSFTGSNKGQRTPDQNEKKPFDSQVSDKINKHDALQSDDIYILLENWRKQQLERVETELRRLKTLDAFIGKELEQTNKAISHLTWESNLEECPPVCSKKIQNKQ